MVMQVCSCAINFKLPYNSPNGVSWNVKSLGNLLEPNALQVQ